MMESLPLHLPFSHHTHKSILPPDERVRYDGVMCQTAAASCLLWMNTNLGFCLLFSQRHKGTKGICLWPVWRGGMPTATHNCLSVHMTCEY